MSDVLEKPQTTAGALCHWMCGAGHFTFAWKKEDASTAEALIQRAMDQGVIFRVVQRKRLRGSKTVEITSLEDIPHREVIIGDDQVQQFLSSGAADPVKADLEPDDDGDDTLPPRRARSAREVRENETIAHRPLVGG